MEYNNIYLNKNIRMFKIFGIYRYFPYSRYFLYFSTIYIYLHFLGNGEDIFNNNLTIIFTIISSYKFINISYYIHLASNLEHL